MNTVRSVGYGWGVLIVAGGGAYYFAKRSINADREERAAQEERRRQAMYRLQANPPPPAPRKQEGHANPGVEAAGDVSPGAGHVDEAARPKYEASEPYRARRGDRFS